MEAAPMSDSELLLHWLSHRAKGTWEQFRTAVSAVGDSGEESSHPGNLARSLSEMAHAQFFVGGSRRWRVFAPCIAGLQSSGHAVMVGARSTALMDALMRGCENHGVQYTSRALSNGLQQVHLAAESNEQIGAASESSALPYLPDFAMRLCGDLRTVTQQLDAAIPTSRPVNWKVRSFDLTEMSWVEEHLTDTAQEFTPTNGISRFALARRGHALVELDKRTATYAAAHINGVPLLQYDHAGGKLTFPQECPMPEPMARVAAMCSGSPSETVHKRRSYSDVRAEIASLLMATVGQAPLAPVFVGGPR
jgi:hypothetical protein